jgi:hypothetical protein
MKGYLEKSMSAVKLKPTEFGLGESGRGGAILSKK